MPHDAKAWVVLFKGEPQWRSISMDIREAADRFTLSKYSITVLYGVDNEPKNISPKERNDYRAHFRQVMKDHYEIDVDLVRVGLKILERN